MADGTPYGRDRGKNEGRVDLRRFGEQSVSSALGLHNPDPSTESVGVALQPCMNIRIGDCVQNALLACQCIP